ncbi:MAG: IS110 family transposase [Myxococcales bacterium]|nr:IS110 family transposase [Myxococcales bacterium]
MLRSNLVNGSTGASIEAGHLELERGPVVSALLEYDSFVLFPVRRDGLAKYRQTFTPSRAKDDPSDALLAADFVLRHPERFFPLQPEMRQLRRLVQDRRQLVQDRTRLTNRLTWHLKAYHPLVLSLFRDKFTDVFLDFVERWPILQALKRARPETLRTFFREGNLRHSAIIEKRLQAIAEARPLTQDSAVIEPAILMVRGLIGQLREVNKAIQSFDDTIEATCAKLPDSAIFKQLPGAGAALAPRLLAAFGENRERFPNAASMQKYAGVAPVTERSGQKSWVHWRFICSTFLRQSFVEWVGETIPRSFWAKAFYERHKAKGVSHKRHHSCPGLQVDPHPLALLARPRLVRRIHLPRGPQEAGVTPPEVCCRILSLILAVRLRAWVGQRTRGGMHRTC